MGHLDLMSLEEYQRNRRFYEALSIEGKLDDVPLSSFTFGELSFLLGVFDFDAGHNVHPDQIEKLREIAQKVGAA